MLNFPFALDYTTAIFFFLSGAKGISLCDKIMQAGKAHASSVTLHRELVH